MKRFLIVSAMALAMAASSAHATGFEVDSAHTRVGFAVKHMVISTVQGEFGKFTGSFELDAKDQLTRAEGKVDMTSINTREQKRDDHLKSPDFFDAQMYPEMTFVSKMVTAKGKKYTVVGDLTIKGVTKRVTLTGEMNGPIKDMMGMKRVGFHAEGTINRKDFNVSFHKALETGALVVDDLVQIVLDVEGTAKN
ncbi:MAG: polyisoprenoid-binding protein [Nitrospinae bacterium]|nr:polyisoprenoid-binding protein [Nitrospinota bacterium]